MCKVFAVIYPSGSTKRVYNDVHHRGKIDVQRLVNKTRQGIIACMYGGDDRIDSNKNW